MAIDPNKMEAFVNKGAPMGGADEGGEGEEAPAEGGEGGEGMEKYQVLHELLEEFNEEVQEAIDELSPEFLAEHDGEVDPDDQKICEQGIKNLDGKLQKEMKAVLPGIPHEMAAELAGALETENAFEDADSLAGWLVRVSETMGGGGGDEEAAPNQEGDQAPSAEDLIDEVDAGE